jgi:hypothetical protein
MKKYYWIVAFISIIFVSGCAINEGGVKLGVIAKIWPPTSLEQCKNFDNFPTKFGEHSRSECYSIIAAKNKDESICDLIEVSEQKPLCIYSVAQAKKDLSLCNKLFPQFPNDTYCVTSVLDTMSAETGWNNISLSICDSLNSPLSKDACLSRIAINTKNTTICPQIKSDYYRNYCLGK